MFTFIEVLEIKKIWIVWETAQKIFHQSLFDNCIKYQLIAKGIFGSFILFISFSAVFLTFFLYINIDYFIEKVFYTFIYYNYLIFGPYMLAFSIIGIVNWENILYICKENRSFHQNFFLDSKRFNNSNLPKPRFFIFNDDNDVLPDYENKVYFPYHGNKRSKNNLTFHENQINNSIDNIIQNKRESDKTSSFLGEILKGITYDYNSKNDATAINPIVEENLDFLNNDHQFNRIYFNYINNSNKINGADEINNSKNYERLFKKDQGRLNSLIGNTQPKKSENNQNKSSSNILLDTNIKQSDIPLQKKNLLNHKLNNNNENPSKHIHKRYISIPNAFNLVISLFISSAICLIMAFYESYDHLIESILRRSQGNPIIGYLFWRAVNHSRNRRSNRERPINNSRSRIFSLTNENIILNSDNINNTNNINNSDIYFNENLNNSNTSKNIVIQHTGDISLEHEFFICKSNNDKDLINFLNTERMPNQENYNLNQNENHLIDLNFSENFKEEPIDHLKSLYYKVNNKENKFIDIMEYQYSNYFYDSNYKNSNYPKLSENIMPNNFNQEHKNLNDVFAEYTSNVNSPHFPSFNMKKEILEIGKLEQSQREPNKLKSSNPSPIFRMDKNFKIDNIRKKDDKNNDCNFRNYFSSFPFDFNNKNIYNTERNSSVHQPNSFAFFDTSRNQYNQNLYGNKKRSYSNRDSIKYPKEFFLENKNSNIKNFNNIENVYFDSLNNNFTFANSNKTFKPLANEYKDQMINLDSDNDEIILNRSFSSKTVINLKNIL